MELKTDEPRSFGLYQMSFDIVVCVSLKTHEEFLHVLLLTQPLVTVLASFWSNLGHDKSCVFFFNGTNVIQEMKTDSFVIPCCNSSFSSLPLLPHVLFTFRSILCLQPNYTFLVT